jgi:hypothetical protein
VPGEPVELVGQPIVGGEKLRVLSGKAKPRKRGQQAVIASWCLTSGQIEMTSGLFSTGPSYLGADIRADLLCGICRKRQMFSACGMPST